MPAVDKFNRVSDELEGPARNCFIITPGASELPVLPKAIRAGAAGTITLQGADDSTPIVHPVMAGERLDLRVRLVTAASPADMVIIGYA